jgi:hypothetical protein
MGKLIALLAAVGGVAAAVYSQLPELRRYTKMRQM